jgi:two-component system, OmpR family, response regulator ChvI
VYLRDNGKPERMKRILIVDDDEDITKALRIGLTKNGYHVAVYNDPGKALSHFKKGAFDLLVLDIRMPQMTGFQLLREIRKIDDEVKACFFTAFEIYLDEFHQLFPEISSDCFLRKPMKIAEFASAIKQLIGE